MDTYRTIETSAEGLYKDKGSKFISSVYHVDTAEQALKIVADIRKKYYDARHVCYAYMLGAERNEYRVNDDGEPSGTAGKPILGQINSNELTNVLVVVVRYFGGILLGTSGLITAYKSAAADAIANAVVVEKIVETQFRVQFGYQEMSYVMRTLKELQANIIQQIQQETCEIIFAIRNGDIQQMESKFTNVKGVTYGKNNCN
ncbi:MAG: YigZ family protein [Paludibacteraceae bacterium]|nr:YigZ family protein [Paludibacteraceae bacterium]